MAVQKRATYGIGLGLHLLRVGPDEAHCWRGGALGRWKKEGGWAARRRVVSYGIFGLGASCTHERTTLSTATLTLRRSEIRCTLHRSGASVDGTGPEMVWDADTPHLGTPPRLRGCQSTPSGTESAACFLRPWGWSAQGLWLAYRAARAGPVLLATASTSEPRAVCAVHAAELVGGPVIASHASAHFYFHISASGAHEPSARYGMPRPRTVLGVPPLPPT